MTLQCRGESIVWWSLGLVRSTLNLYDSNAKCLLCYYKKKEKLVPKKCDRPFKLIKKLVPKNGCPKIKCDRPFLNSSKWRNTVVN